MQVVKKHNHLAKYYADPLWVGMSQTPILYAMRVDLIYEKKSEPLHRILEQWHHQNFDISVQPKLLHQLHISDTETAR